MQSNKATTPLILGVDSIIEAIEQGRSLEKIFLLRTAGGAQVSTLRQLARRHSIPLSPVPREKLDRLHRSFQGEALAWVSWVNYQDLESVIDSLKKKGENPLFALVDGVTDVRNLGAIGRSLYGCGGQCLILPVSSSASLTAESIKASAQTLPSLALCRMPSVAQTIDLLRQQGIQVLASDLREARPVHQVDLRPPTCFILGSEDKGIGKEARRLSDQRVRLPMVGDLDSFNVSVAAGMFFYEAMRQRSGGKASPVTG